MPIALMYHDVVPAGQEESSGFPGAGAAPYKLTPELFGAHLEALAAGLPSAPLASPNPAELFTGPGWLITFDDGGRTAIAPIADLLEAKGWRGYFFITTDYLDAPGFLTRQHVQDLH